MVLLGGKGCKFGLYVVLLHRSILVAKKKSNQFFVVERKVRRTTDEYDNFGSRKITQQYETKKKTRTIAIDSVVTD